MKSVVVCASMTGILGLILGVPTGVLHAQDEGKKAEKQAAAGAEQGKGGPSAMT